MKTYVTSLQAMRWRAGSLLVALLMLAAEPAGFCENPGAEMMRNMSRGVFNVVASPVELPRMVVYETAENWAYGPFLGLGEGVFCMVFRELLASWDIVTFGLLPEGTSPYRFYKTKDYFWEEDWLPPGPQSSEVKDSGKSKDEDAGIVRPIKKRNNLPSASAQ